jgi:hypothetical protein
MDGRPWRLGKGSTTHMVAVVGATHVPVSHETADYGTPVPAESGPFTYLGACGSVGLSRGRYDSRWRGGWQEMRKYGSRARWW